MLLIVSAVFLAFAGFYFFWLWWRASKKTLPLNSVSGLRTRAIMSSSSVWKETHYRYAVVFLADAILFIISSALLIVQIISDASIKSSEISLKAVEYSFYADLGLILLVTIIGGLSADRFARQLLLKDRKNS